MDLAKVLTQLKQELENLNAAITSLERIEQSKLRRRGRPPGSSNNNPGKKPPSPKNRKRP